MSIAKSIINSAYSMKISDREFEVLYLIAYEYSNRKIAEMLFLSINTIDTYRRRLFMKFNVNNAAGLIRRAHEEGIFPMDKPDFINGCPKELVMRNSV